jgi:hypothetical protein
MNNTIICDTPEKINAYHLLSLKMALKLETVGLKVRGGSAANTIRELIGSKTRDKKTLLVEYTFWLNNNLIA